MNGPINRPSDGLRDELTGRLTNRMTNKVCGAEFYIMLDTLQLISKTSLSQHSHALLLTTQKTM